MRFLNAILAFSTWLRHQRIEPNDVRLFVEFKNEIDEARGYRGVVEEFRDGVLAAQALSPPTTVQIAGVPVVFTVRDRYGVGPAYAAMKRGDFDTNTQWMRRHGLDA